VSSRCVGCRWVGGCDGCRLAAGFAAGFLRRLLLGVSDRSVEGGELLRLFCAARSATGATRLKVEGVVDQAVWIRMVPVRNPRDSYRQSGDGHRP